ncbi:hypothetical protein NLX83_30605 [Allokutzneria sp. A3M-2-11 16]|uniref:hypothetical protein n=1 Tax=Allokutzneria sp. A3M-2-11 16 TaxID=2962043 RepID=UPI0020B83232|nr:hypothetical protein [Allokutzneria sp. A3M-2-11 16]MCP3803632.1 hypothetical protein [Allokutzneria sp. A3M-2-11 16]
MSLFLAILVLLVLAPLALLVVRVPVGPQKLLTTWGAHEADEGDLALAGAYLKRRRLLYLAAVALSLVVFLLTGSKLDGVGPFLLWVLLPLSLALLASELTLVGHRPGEATTRRASLVPRSRRDYVPRWATRTVLALLVLSLPSVFVMAPFRESFSLHLDFWIATAFLVGLGAVAETTIRLAVARRPVVESAADTAMRVRSARAMAGLELGITGFTFLITWAGWGFAMGFFAGREPLAWIMITFAVAGFVTALTGWGFLASPPRTVRRPVTPTGTATETETA